MSKKLYTLPLCLLLVVLLMATMGAVHMTLVAPTLPPLVMGNLGVDNGPAIQEWIKKGAKIPSGRYYVSTTIVTSNQQIGCSLIGSGMPDQVRGDTLWDAVRTPATILIWNGAPDGILLQVQSGGFRCQDIGLQGLRCYTTTPGNTNISDGGEEILDATVVRFFQLDPDPPKWYPVGNIVFDHVYIGAGKYAWFTNGDDHCDHITISNCNTHYVLTPLYVNERQSVEWHINALTCSPGGGNKGVAVFDFVRGGRMRAEITPLDNWETFIKLPDPPAAPPPAQSAYNSAMYSIFVWLDGTTYIDNMCVERSDRGEYSASLVDITGYGASETNVGPPINIARTPTSSLNPVSRFTMNIKRVRPSTPDLVYPAP